MVAEPVIQPGGDLMNREDPQPGGGQLNRQSDAVQAATNLGNGFGVFCGEFEVGPDRSRSVQEESYRLIVG